MAIKFGRPIESKVRFTPVESAPPQTTLDLTGLKCPLPALKTRKALKSVKPGDLLEVHCTDPLSVIDIPSLIRETGDKIEITERTEQRIVFLIEKAKPDTAGPLA